jgi:hypothetical protein
MNKKGMHRQELEPFFDSLLADSSSDALIAYLVAQSNLPGRRANLELAQAFGDTVAFWASEKSQALWAFCTQLTAISPDEAPVNHPREFFPFCGAIGLGAVGAAAAVYLEPALQALHELANDPRWRLREAVCFGLQRLLGADAQRTVASLQSWLPEGSWLELRAAAAAVAEPTLLQERVMAHSALDLHQRILERVQDADAPDRKTDPFKTLRQGLGYTPSVVVQALPDEGFAWLAQLAESQDRDVLWIVRQNLKKNRLVRGFPDQVERLTRRVKSET